MKLLGPSGPLPCKKKNIYIRYAPTHFQSPTSLARSRQRRQLFLYSALPALSLPSAVPDQRALYLGGKFGWRRRSIAPTHFQSPSSPSRSRQRRSYSYFPCIRCARPIPRQPVPMAAPPRPPRQKLDFTGCNVCAPIQRNIGDIPVIHFDAALGVQHYSNVMLKRTNRARGIGPATFYGSAITPTENPQNRRVDPVTRKKVVDSGASHHIIQICYSAQKKDPNLAVQLLVNDVNGYITAKRVRRNGVFGAWQQFTDIDGAEVPEFLNAQVVDLPASHDVTSTTIGGSMEEMFYGLVGPVEDKKAARLALRRAIILFCEAFWLRSIYLEMIRRLLHKEVATGLSEQAWARIGSWKVLSRFLIYLAKYGKKLDAVLASKLALYAEQYGISTFEQLTGELQVLRYSDESLLTNSVKKALAHKKAGMGIKDPKFPRA